MAITLSKGQRIDLTKTNPDLVKVTVGLGWDVNRYNGGHEFDLDASVFLLDENGRARNELDFIFYNNLVGGNGSVVHQGDNRTGEGDGDDEQIVIDLPSVPANIHRIAFTITIHDAALRNQSFGQVDNSFVRLVNQETDEEILHYDLGEDFSIETAMVVAELYRHGREWKFNAIGSGFSGGLADLVRNYGLEA